MKNIRIWTRETKRSEGVWLEYLLTLCGCRVWKGFLSEEYYNNTRKDISAVYQYIDIFLFEEIESRFCDRIAEFYSERKIWISGSGSYFLPSFWWEMSDELKLEEPTTIVEMMRELSKYIAEEQYEIERIQRITDAYINNDNALAKSMYTVNELFCSRRINYSLYENKNVLLETIALLETWHHEYGMSSYRLGKMAFSEMFALTYIQNMINDAYIKARVPGGFDVRVVLSNVDYLLKCDPDCDSALLLKLRIMRNCIDYPENPEKLLKKIVVNTAPPYLDKGYCEMGDIIRENADKVFYHTPADYFERARRVNPNAYTGVYKLGYIFERKGRRDAVWYERAAEMYREVIESIRLCPEFVNWTPHEFEYYYKAAYGALKVKIELNKIYNNKAKWEMYDNEKEKLNMEIMNYKKLRFWHKFYGDKAEYKNALAVMKEKMQGIRRYLD